MHRWAGNGTTPSRVESAHIQFCVSFMSEYVSLSCVLCLLSMFFAGSESRFVWTIALSISLSVAIVVYCRRPCPYLCIWLNARFYGVVFTHPRCSLARAQSLAMSPTIPVISVRVQQQKYSHACNNNPRLASQRSLHPCTMQGSCLGLRDPHHSGWQGNTPLVRQARVVQCECLARQESVDSQ